MSRIGNNPVKILDGVKVSVANGAIAVEGPKGKLNYDFRPEIEVKVDEDSNSVIVSPRDLKQLTMTEWSSLDLGCCQKDTN